MCGESLSLPLRLTMKRGSPPHVWGKHKKDNQGILRHGITPTCVGKAVKNPLVEY